MPWDSLLFIGSEQRSTIFYGFADLTLLRYIEQKPSLCSVTPQTKQSSMASPTSSTIFYGFVAVFVCLHLVEEATTQAQDSASHSPFTQIAAAAFLPAVVTTFVLAHLLLVLHVRAHGAGAAEEDAGRLFLRRLTLLAATAALLAGAVMCLFAAGYLGGGGADVGWPHRKK